MSKSPGHRKWPTHNVLEQRLAQPMQARVNGEVIAESPDVVQVNEDDHPARYYFPRADVPAHRLVRSQTTTECPFKGTAHYFSLHASGKEFPDAVWTYEQPFDEHVARKDRLAFYVEKVPGMVIAPK